MPRHYTTKPVRLLQRTGNHLRTDLGDEHALRQLGQSYLARPYYPIIADATTLEILDGNRRCTGVMAINPDADVPVCLIDEPWGEKLKLEIQLESAAHTKGLNDYETYLGCMQWLRLNPTATAKELAEKLPYSESSLSKILSLAKGIPPVQEAARAGRLNYAKWWAICRMPPEAQPSLLAAALTDGATRDELQRRGRTRKEEATPVVRMPRIRIPLASETATGTVTVAGESLDLDDAETLLKDALRAVKQAKDKAWDTKTAQAVWRDTAKAGSGTA